MTDFAGNGQEGMPEPKSPKGPYPLPQVVQSEVRPQDFPQGQAGGEKETPDLTKGCRYGLEEEALEAHGHARP